MLAQGFLLLLLFWNGKSIPMRGNQPWTVLLCKFYDIQDEPKNFDFFTRWLFDNEEGSITDYFRKASNGLYSIDGSNVYGWFSIPYTKSSIDALAASDPQLTKYKSSEQKMFHKTKQLCRETAYSLNFDINKKVITIINDGSFAIFCSEDGVLLSPSYVMTAALAHEMVHSFHIGHSFSDKLLRVYPYSKLGEYDDKYDLMSTSNAFMYPTDFGMNGPGLSGPHLDYLGWLPAHRLLFFGSDGASSGVYRLSSLSVPHEETSGNLLIYIPYDRNSHLNYYTVELRTKISNDKGIPGQGLVVIHRIKDFKGYLFSFLITGQNANYGWTSGQKYMARLGHPSEQKSIHIHIRHINTEHHWAEIEIRSDFRPTDCASNEIMRNAFPGDQVCIHWRERDMILASNKLDSKRRRPNAQCFPGFQHRLAGPQDLVCASSEEKAIIDAQNSRWNKRSNFFNVDTFGLNACKTGFVWRQIDNYDFTCVSADIRRQIRRQRFQRTNRAVDGAACSPGFFWRESFPGDKVCVTHDERLEAQEDSINGQYRLIYRKFFNGIDTVD